MLTTITIRNRTRYFAPAFIKGEVTLTRPDVYWNQQAKVEGYNQRLWYHYKYIESIGGQTFLYTHTYNDKALPHFLGIPVHRYSDIDWFFRESGFDRELRNKYGAKIQYFVASEFGEGGADHLDHLAKHNKVAKRGLDMNPHYHTITFLSDGHYKRTVKRLEPVLNEVGEPVVFQRGPRKGETKMHKVKVQEIIPYRHITPQDYFKLCKKYWQGTYTVVSNGVEVEKTTEKWQNARFGMVMHSKYNMGLCTNGSGIKYASEYTNKDVLKEQSRKVYARICKYVGDKCVLLDADGKLRLNTYLFTDDFWNAYLHTRFNVAYYCDKDIHRPWQDFLDYVQQYNSAVDWWREPHTPVDMENPFIDITNYASYEQLIKLFWIDIANSTPGSTVFSVLADFRASKIASLWEEYTQEHKPRVRISQGLGESAKYAINDGKIKMQTGKGFKMQKACTYLMRKKYYDVEKDAITGNNRYTLNDDGIAYKMAHLDERIDKTRQKADTALHYIWNTPSIYEEIPEKYAGCKDLLPLGLENFNSAFAQEVKNSFIDSVEITNLYAIYKTVYEGQNFKLYNDGSCDRCSAPALDYRSDYYDFISYKPSADDAWINTYSINRFARHSEYTSYREHPVFYPLRFLFEYVRFCIDFMDYKQSEQQKKTLREREQNKKRVIKNLNQ